MRQITLMVIGSSTILTLFILLMTTLQYMNPKRVLD